MDHSASKRTGRTVVRGFDDEPDPDAEPDDEDYASVDDMFFAAHARLKHGNWPGATTDDVAGHLRAALDHEPRSLTNRTVRSAPISNDELLAAAKDAHDRRMDLHARYKSPNKIQGDVQAFITRAKAKKGMPEHMVWGRVRSALVEGSAKNARVSKKIAILRREGMPQKQAIATALSMERAHRIRDDGSYVRAESIAEHVIPASPQDVRKKRIKRKRMYHPHLKQGYRSAWHHKAPGVQHDLQHASNANGPWARLHYGPGGVTDRWRAPGVHETVTSGSVGTGPATALGATTPAPAANPAQTLAPHVPPLASVRPNWTQANKQRFAPRSKPRQARIVYRGYSPKV